MDCIANHLPRDTCVNVMSQYRTACKPFDSPPIARRLTRAEHERAVDAARAAGLTQIDLQGW